MRHVISRTALARSLTCAQAACERWGGAHD